MSIKVSGGGGQTIPGLTSDGAGNLTFHGDSTVEGNAFHVVDSTSGAGSAITGESSGDGSSSVYGYNQGSGGFGVTGFSGADGGVGLHGVATGAGSNSVWGEGPMASSRGLSLFGGPGADYDQVVAGARTASGTYGATEQTMLQTVYDALRLLGLLS